MQGTGLLKNNIGIIYNERKKAALYGLCTYYAALALRTFREIQRRDYFWMNQTYLAMDTMHTGAFKEGKDMMGWFMAHTQQYGVYLELANNRQNESIRPIIKRYLPRFRADVQRIYSDN